MAAAREPAGSAASAAGHLYPVDVKDEKPEVLEAAAREYYEKLVEQPSSAAEFFSVPGREKVKVETSLLRFLPLYKQDKKRMLLVLNDPQRKNAVLGIYLHSSWWLIEDIVKTADLSREGLLQVQTYAERIVLFVLNYIIFGMQERSSAWDVLFVPHSEKENARIFWRNGEAAAFYTVKAKGSLCDGYSGQCYLLPVLDTVFVRKKFRRCGLGTKMLHDFCQTFVTEDALGISRPISADMYRVCQRFLDTHLEERARLWEVEAPGDWSQRVSIWLKIQLAQNLPKKVDQSSHAEKFQDDKPGPSEDSQMKKRAVQVSDIQVSPDQAEEFKDDSEKPLDSQLCIEECISQQEGEVHLCEELKKRKGEPADDRVLKQLRVVSHDEGSCF
ncbi:protein FAM169B-like [Eublepharis macularius]|uniref:Protein FAM169B-like n=1 Tax=Eublepharis macularius TaxID=481883 RepID=A0AA97KME0_EUBMA|nr:protein FAM169B-like [Eublepharis macularius]